MIRHRFPEDLFPPINRKQWNLSIDMGYQLLIESDLCLVGLARNIEYALELNLIRIDYLRTLCKSLRWVIVTNGNSDRTLEVLENYARKDDLILSLDDDRTQHASVVSEERYRDMAFYRNQYVPHLGGEYTIVYDLDILGGFSYDGLANSFIQFKGDMIGSNGIIYQNGMRLYYDALAFRRLGKKGPHDTTEINLLNYTRGEDLIRVQSCFGGLGIYKTESLVKSEYQAWDCDHVTINKNLECYLNPSQIILYSDNPYCV